MNIIKYRNKQAADYMNISTITVTGNLNKSIKYTKNKRIIKILVCTDI